MKTTGVKLTDLQLYNVNDLLFGINKVFLILKIEIVYLRSTCSK